jgi:8-oxo-dGTP pyrophosphatase MutT (NUDIX family)
MMRIKLYEEFEFVPVNRPVEVVVGLLIRSSKGRFFLVHRGDGARFWSLMSGGQDESDSDDVTTIRREMSEELMLHDTSNIKIEYVGEENITSKRRVFRYYIAHVDKEFDAHLDHENLDWGWFHPHGDSMINGHRHTWGLPYPLYPGLLDKIVNFPK